MQPDPLRIPTVCEGNSQTSDLTTRPCFPHLTTEPRPFNPQTGSLFSGKVARGRLPPPALLEPDGWKEEKASRAPHALQAQAQSASHPKARKAISTQTCTHPTQVRTPARRVTYVSSLCTVPNCRHIPAPVMHLKWTGAHRPPGMKATQIGTRVRLPFLLPRFFSCPGLSNYNYLSNQRIASTCSGVSVSPKARLAPGT